MKLRTKLISGFMAVAVIVLVIGFVGWRGMSRLHRYLKDVEQVRIPGNTAIAEINQSLLEMEAAIKALLNPDQTAAAMKAQFARIDSAERRIEQALEIYGSLPKSEPERAVFESLAPALATLKESIETYLDLSRALLKTGIINPARTNIRMVELQDDLNDWLFQLVTDVFNESEISVPTTLAETVAGRRLAGFSTDSASLNEKIRELADAAESLVSSAQIIQSFSDTIGEESARFAVQMIFANQLIPAMADMATLIDDMENQIAEPVQLYRRMNDFEKQRISEHHAAVSAVIQDLLTENNRAAQAGNRRIDRGVKQSNAIVLTFMVLGTALAATIGLLLSFYLSKPIHRVARGLIQSVGSLKASSGHFESASKTLADGSSEQAASLEESSSSLEEISAMTQKNAEKADEATILIEEADETIHRSNQIVADLTASISEISSASKEAQKIVKTIDEIAFQTNLLALNAAIEAARAGETGAGFAVVADEVRNLALRAAEAATHTSELIEGIVGKIKDGAAYVQKTNSAFGEIEISSRKVAAIVTEIAVSSKEQAEGIEQINHTVAEMDRITQQNAANAEETASASRELRSQADQLNRFVEKLTAIVGANSRHAVSSEPDTDSETFTTPLLPEDTHNAISNHNEREKRKVDEIELF